MKKNNRRNDVKFNPIDIVNTIRLGFDPLGPIITQLSENKLEREMIPFLYDLEVQENLLYILTELPSIDNAVCDKILDMKVAQFSDSGLLSAHSIIFHCKKR